MAELVSYSTMHRLNETSGLLLPVLRTRGVSIRAKRPEKASSGPILAGDARSEPVVCLRW